MGKKWFDFGYAIKKLDNTRFNYLFHAIDLVGAEEIDYRFPPLLGKSANINVKMGLCNYIMSKISGDYRVLPTKELLKNIYT
ncbi:MAG: hypothetical protein FJZ15_06520 [Candidatus Omnitrophica bacterium]|nr:hypothetical protein [Candidatus Omnitrophota bacterium]